MVTPEPDDPPADQIADQAEVSFAEVAAEDPSESLEHEAELVEVDEPGVDPGVDSGQRAGTDEDWTPGQPTLGASMGGAPVPGVEEPPD